MFRYFRVRSESCHFELVGYGFLKFCACDSRVVILSWWAMASSTISPAHKPSSKLNNTSSTDPYEDELFTWLQYPTDDVFERSYCSDMCQGAWPSTEANPDVVSHKHVNGSFGSLSSMGTNTCETGSLPCASLVARKNMSTKTMLSSRSSRNASIADEALAQGAERAAGYSSQVGQEAYSKVKTLMQRAHVNDPLSTPSHSFSAFKESKDHTIKPNLPVSSVPACPPQLLQNARCTKLNMLDSPPMSKTKHATSKRARTEYEAHSHTHQIESSQITEEGAREWNNMVEGADQRCTVSSTSYSAGTSQTSMSLSCRETVYSGKRKEDLELLMDEYADDESMDLKKRSKSNLSRRNRVAEVHNLSERNRRNRINEKLKALQDLIPNSCKTDKASVLDEAIEYMKNLQMQLQMVSMRNSLNVSPMMMPMALPRTHMHVAQPHSIGIGVPIGHAAGMGIGCLGVGMETGHVMPFQSGSIAGFTHMGFLQTPQIPLSMQTVQEPYEHVSQRHAYMRQHKQHKQGRSLLRRHPHNSDQQERQTIEQDEDVSD